MSKIGRLPVLIPQDVTVNVAGGQVSVNGPKGNLSFDFRPEIKVEVKENAVIVSRKNETKFTKALHGLTRSIVANMVKGVSEGHEKVLEVVGVGYRAVKQGEDLVLSVGYSHPVIIKPMAGTILDTKDNKIIITGADKVIVGEMAAQIRRVRPPEPYKGKGIKYFGEFIKRKAGKAAKTGGAA